MRFYQQTIKTSHFKYSKAAVVVLAIVAKVCLALAVPTAQGNEIDFSIVSVTYLKTM